MNVIENVTTGSSDDAGLLHLLLGASSLQSQQQESRRQAVLHLQQHLDQVWWPCKSCWHVSEATVEFHAEDDQVLQRCLMSTVDLCCPVTHCWTVSLRLASLYSLSTHMYCDRQPGEVTNKFGMTTFSNFISKGSFFNFAEILSFSLPTFSLFFIFWKFHALPL